VTTVEPPPLAPAPSLSTVMREGSMAQHTAAEGTDFVTELLAGRLDRAAYVDYLRCLRAVYATLESLVRGTAADAVVAAVHDPDLERLAALDADLAFWDPAPLVPTTSPAAAAYVDHLTSLAGGPATRVVAHHYTRYLGDLSGGQVIGRLLGRTYGLPAGSAGLSFYAFGAVPKPKRYKDAYRARLDALPLDAAGRAEVVDEVCRAFEHNQRLLTALGDRHVPRPA